MAELPRCRLTTWREVDRWADKLAGAVTDANRVPDTLVALTRGGWVPARLLSDRLGVRRVVSVRAQHWGVTATPSGRAEITEGLSGAIQGENVLLVDDITDTGESLELAAEKVGAAGPTRVESATFLHITHSKFVPTYFAEEIARDAWVWIVFPWNYWEDLATLAPQALKVAGDLPAAKALLEERCGLKVPLSDLKRVTSLGSPVP
ncbi:MAG: phosphoribosyltransferase [Thermoplasmata archaeon]|nr:phosphoribosyltransferase [Thermoplasmata archaeon]